MGPRHLALLLYILMALMLVLCGLAWFVYRLDWEWQVTLRANELMAALPSQIAAAQAGKRACGSLLWAATVWTFVGVLVSVRKRDLGLSFAWLMGLVIMLAECRSMLLCARDLVLSIGFRT